MGHDEGAKLAQEKRCWKRFSPGVVLVSTQVLGRLAPNCIAQVLAQISRSRLRPSPTEAHRAGQKFNILRACDVCSWRNA